MYSNMYSSFLVQRFVILALSLLMVLKFLFDELFLCCTEFSLLAFV